MKTKEGGLMDIQKEREAFEIVFSVPEGVVWCYAKNRYIAKNTSFIFACAAFNSAFEVWQAKAQAVPEGFILVPKEPTYEMLEAGSEARSRTEGHVASIWGAMIEAQEPAND